MAEPVVSEERGGFPGVLLTKLYPPTVRSQWVARERLIERLQAGPGVRLTVVIAPAGSGKTTLLGAWQEVESVRRPVGWVSLDEGDNDPVVLWTHVLEALRRLCPALGAVPSPEIVGAARIAGSFLPDLVNGLTEQGSLALVLDDFHRVLSGPSRESVAWLVEHAPQSFQLVVSTRTEPALPLASLRAHGELLELRAGDLGFNANEADVFLNDRLELGLARDDVDELVERTEGWPAGLYLAALSLRGVEDRHEFVGRFGGTNRPVVDFLVEEVLEGQDPALQTLMLRSSVLERLCAPLCDALLENEGSAEQLRELARTNLFLLPLDDHGQWFRFHHVFRQLLRVELEHREPGAAPTLHRRASGWHRNHGSTAEAVDHALEAGAWAEARDLISSTWLHLMSTGRHATALGWLDRVPAEVLASDPVLLVVKAWVLALSGEREAATSAIAALESEGTPDVGALPDGFSSLEASLATLRATFPWGDFGGGTESGRRAAELEGPTSPWWPLVCHSLGACLYVSGEFEEAVHWLDRATASALAREQWRVAVSSLAYRALVAGELELIDEQELLAGDALLLAREHGLEEVEGEVFIAHGASLAARGELEQALAALERGAAVLRPLRHPRGLAEALTRQAFVLQALDRREAAEPVIEEARTIVASCPDPRLLAERLTAVERRPSARRAHGGGTLSAREFVVLRALNGPLSERDIARELYLSHSTVHSHTQSIYRKLGVSSRAEAVRRARELGLL
jgi:LuxR family transcriptional regulator, maltose regulon positive regulatory protein